MGVHALLDSRIGRTLGVHNGRRILLEKETRGIKLFAALIMSSLKNPRAASTDAKDERSVEILVARENLA